MTTFATMFRRAMDAANIDEATAFAATQESGLREALSYLTDLAEANRATRNKALSRRVQDRLLRSLPATEAGLRIAQLFYEEALVAHWSHYNEPPTEEYLTELAQGVIRAIAVTERSRRSTSAGPPA